VTVVNRYITVSREVDGDDGKKKSESLDLVPGQDAPDWAVELIKREHLGDPRDPLEEETDQFLISLRQTATSEGIPWTEEWNKGHLTQAITAVRQAKAGGRTLDLTQFGPPGDAPARQSQQETPDGGSGEPQLKSVDDMSADELKAEYEQHYSEKPHHALSETNLRSRVQEARDKA
jgi:hypothetical protein